MKVKNIILIISVISCFLISSCSSIGNIPLIPDSVQFNIDRQGSAESETGDVQVFEIDGVRVTFYRSQMRILIETEPDAKIEKRNAEQK